MHKTITMVAMTAVCLAGSLQSRAEEAEKKGGPSKYIQIYREDVRPGKGAAHAKVEAGWPVALAKAGSKGHYLALVTAGTAWFVTPWETMAAAEADEKAVDASPGAQAELERLSATDGELLNKVGSVWAEHVADIDYGGEWDVAKMRYVWVTTIHVKPGYGREFVELRKLVREAHEKAKVAEKWVFYEVFSGAANGTYLMFSPMATLAEGDTDPHDSAYREALGESARTKLRDFWRAGVQYSETTLFSVDPKMSYPPKTVVDRDPEFWAPKPASGKKANP